MVRLQPINDLFAEYGIKVSLNSTMVRLQLCLPAGKGDGVPGTSQFHYGSITTVSWKVVSEFFVATVSIPLWFDYNKSGGSETVIALQVSQFHYGSITTIECTVLWGKRNIYIVSIPLWFDYNTTTKLQALIMFNASLNSTMVRLQPLKFLFYLHLFKLCLNSTMVRLQHMVMT